MELELNFLLVQLYMNLESEVPLLRKYGMAPLSSITGTIEINKTKNINIKLPIIFLIMDISLPNEIKEI